MHITNDLLSREGVELDILHSTPNTSGTFEPGLPDTIIIHYTAGRDALSSVKTLTDNAVKASAHLVIGRDGKVYQLAPFNWITWHAGVSAWHGRKNLNRYSIGIELDNAGALKKQGNEFLSWFGRSYPKEEVFVADLSDHSDYSHRVMNSRYWHRYTEEQIYVTEQICSALIKTYPIKEILGHEEISPGRKIDPGPAFPIRMIRNHLLGGDRERETEDNF